MGTIEIIFCILLLKKRKKGKMIKNVIKFLEGCLLFLCKIFNNKLYYCNLYLAVFIYVFVLLVCAIISLKNYCYF